MRETYERNGIEKIVDNNDNDGILWSNEKTCRKRIKSPKFARNFNKIQFQT